MDSKQFYYEVVKLRSLQKNYFQTRSSEILRASKRQEKMIDEEIDRVNRIIQSKNNPNLFQNETDQHQASPT